MYILANKETCYRYNDYAKELLIYFIGKFKRIYGEKYLTYNLHGLIHLPSDVMKFGPLDDFSAFPDENNTMSIKKTIRKSECPLQQLARHLSEKKLSKDVTVSNLLPHNIEIYSHEHFDGPILDGYGNPQFW